MASVTERMIRLTNLLVLSNAGLSGITIRPDSKYIHRKVTVIAKYGRLPRLLIGAVFCQRHGVPNCRKYSVGRNPPYLYV